jgi:RNA polymerase sigma factor (TIGR02999 family)
VSDVTRILQSIEDGNPQAAEELLPLVYDELRKLAATKMAGEQPGQTLQATALVHEAYLRLVTAGDANAWDSRRHFFAAAAEGMRRILIERARHKKTLKRSGERHRRDLGGLDIAAPNPDVDLLALDESLEQLAKLDPRKAELVKLRYFAGLTIPQAAELLGIGASTADKYWAYAKCWLRARMEQTGDS